MKLNVILRCKNRLRIIEGKITKKSIRIYKGSKNHFELAGFRVIEGSSYQGVTVLPNFKSSNQ